MKLTYDLFDDETLFTNVFVVVDDSPIVLVQFLEEEIGMAFIVSDEPQIIGALGAALFAEKEVRGLCCS